MKGDKKRAGDIAALGRLLESHGADRTRWPAPERLRFAGLLKGDPEARSMLAEAAALDRLLDMAPRIGVEREAALADRILAGAKGMEQMPATAGHEAPRQVKAAGAVAPAGSRITRLDEVRGAGALADRNKAGPVRAVRGLTHRIGSNWPAAGLLAASLFIGILTGGSGVILPALQGLPGIAQSDSDSEGLHLALGAEGGIAPDEDTL